MNEYLKVFQNITQSSDQLLTDKNNSLEIQQSATSIKNSVQLCLEELKQSASKLNDLVQAGITDLDHAEDVWNSKPKIAEAAKEEIWVQIGEISGRYVSIRHIASKGKDDAIKFAIAAWKARLEFLGNKWFFDSKGQVRKVIGFSDKDGFLKALDTKIELQYQEMCLLIQTGLALVYKEISSIQLEAIQHCVSLLDTQAQALYSKQFELIVSELGVKFTNPTEHLPNYLINFKTSVKADSEALKAQQGWLIYWEDVVDFNKIVSSKMDKYITAIFDDRVELTTKALEEAIAFYNEFLERQNRYQQETPQQRQAEKAWIDQQYQELAQLKIGLEAILKDS